jgi:hypothetical protein
MRVRALVLVGIATLAAFGFARDSVAKDPAPKNDWDSTYGGPAWVETPPAAAGMIRVVDTTHVDALSNAAQVDPAHVLDRVRDTIVWRLRPLLADEADTLFDVALPAPTLVKKAYDELPDYGGPPLDNPGPTSFLVWMLWEVPAAPVLEKVPAAKRAEAERLLASAEPADTPAWMTLAQSQVWSPAHPVGPGAFPAAFSFSASMEATARAMAIGLARAQIVTQIVERLRGVLEPSDVARVAERAATWARCTARSAYSGVHSSYASVWWDVPIERIVAFVPEAKREAARAALLKPKPAK